MSTVLGLDIGGANLKAATSDRRAKSIAFALWKQPDKLPAALAELCAEFADCDEIAVTMTGELCDCFETKRDGVNCILNAVLNVSRSRPVWVWGTDGKWRHTEDARRDYRTVAAANWHALATYLGRLAPSGPAILIDIGSTTSDIIPLADGLPVAKGRTDTARLASGELLYTGVVRTPLTTLIGFDGAAELFATTLDAYLLLGEIPESRTNTDTADGRPATKANAHSRIARMWCSDGDLMPMEQTLRVAERVQVVQLDKLDVAVRKAKDILDPDLRYRFTSQPVIEVFLSGYGEFLARKLARRTGFDLDRTTSLSDQLGPALSACAPAFAVATLLAERRP